MTARTVAPGFIDELDARRLELTVDQVVSVRWPVVFWTLFMALLVARDVPWPLTIGWALLVLLTREWRTRLLTRLRADRQRPAGLRLRAAKWSILLAGVPQGASAMFMVWLDRPLDAVLTMVLVSLTAGAVSTSSLIPGAFLLYGACVLLPTAAMWSSAFDFTGIGVALLVLMFLGVQNRFANNNRRTFEDSFRIRRENDELVHQLAEARDRAEAATLAKVRFFAAASHDLRQPLHALSMQSAALSMAPDADDKSEVMRGMSQSIDNLSRLLDALLDVSRLDAGTLKSDPRPVNLSRLMRSLASSAHPLAQAKGLELVLTCPDGVVARTDPLLLERLLRNVIDNAIKYTDRGKVELSLTAGTDGARIEVRDSGCGIAAQYHKRVFDEFFRVDDGHGSQQQRGLGLGLSIVRRLAELLELRLSLDSEPGRGTCIGIDFAATQPDEPVPSERKAPEPASLAGLRVLVVDDDDAVLEATAALLRRLGCQVVTADGIETAVAVADPAPHLVLTDYRLRNGETGIALVRRLTALYPGLPAVLITADTAPDRLREADESALPLLHKPVNADSLRALIAGLVHQETAAPTASGR